MSDLIERQMAIEAVKDADVCVFYSDNQSIYDVIDYVIRATKGSVIASIEQLSSTQPKIIRCKECKHHWIHRCMDSMPSEICELDQTFYDANVDFCSLAERRTDEGYHQQTGGD